MSSIDTIFPRDGADKVLDCALGEVYGAVVCFGLGADVEVCD